MTLLDRLKSLLIGYRDTPSEWLSHRNMQWLHRKEIEMYDYREAIKNDIREWLEDNDFYEPDELYEELWINDSVTGNASGSYTFNSYMAQEYVCDNMDDLAGVCEEFGITNEQIGEKFLNGEWEWMDVTIRCYLLGECLQKVIDEV